MRRKLFVRFFYSCNECHHGQVTHWRKFCSEDDCFCEADYKDDSKFTLDSFVVVLVAMFFVTFVWEFVAALIWDLNGFARSAISSWMIAPLVFIAFLLSLSLLGSIIRAKKGK